MKTVKVTVKREQIEKALGEKFPIRRISTRGVGLFSSITQREYSCPSEITLELPVEQVEELMHPPFEGPVETLRCHDFEEVEMGGLGKIKRCRICGTARGVKQDGKRKFRILKQDRVGPSRNDIEHGTIVELEEVE